MDVITSNFNFSIEQRLILDNAVRMAREDAGETFDEEVQLEDEDSPPYPTINTEPQVKPDKWQRVRETNEYVKLIALKRRRESVATKLDSYLDSEDLPVASSGWVGSGADPFDETRHEEFSMEELLGPQHSMRLVDWNGQVSRPVVDAYRRVIGVLVGNPHDDKWAQVEEDVTVAFAAAGDAGCFTAENSDHRRGRFRALAAGISFGGGRKLPGNVLNGAINTAILASLMSNSALIRIAGFASAMLATYAPQLFKLYDDTFTTLLNSNPRLRRNFSNSVFAAATFNFGPRTVTYPHLDLGNLAFGWCAITSFGPFNPDRGGHLVLWDLGLIIRFPPGSTIIIPSALLRHSNVPIEDGEVRYSFTQYTAGGIFRYVYNGFRNDKEFEEMATPDEKARRQADREKRWQEGLKMFTCIDNL